MKNTINTCQELYNKSKLIDIELIKTKLMPNNEDWPKYIELSRNSGPRENLVRAMDLFSIEKIKGTAIDLGAGAGNDIRYLLNLDWNIIGFDFESSSVEIINTEFAANTKFKMYQADFKEIKFKPVELINCSYVLPFCETDYFEKLMSKIIKNIKSGGRFAGNFFAPNHSWTNCTLKSKEEVLTYFKDFEIEYFHETEIDRKSAMGEDIHFHNFDVVAKKK
jgi:tellurite methyltransferase